MTRKFASENRVPSTWVDTRMISDALLLNIDSCALQQCDLQFFYMNITLYKPLEGRYE